MVTDPSSQDDPMEQHRSNIERTGAVVAEAIHTLAKTKHELDKARIADEATPKRVFTAAKAYRQADFAAVEAVKAQVQAYRDMFTMIDEHANPS